MSAFWNSSGREAEMRPNQQDDQDSFTHLGNMYTYLDADDRQRGPFSLSQLISWCADGRLLPTTRVRQQHCEPRTLCALSHVPGFSAGVRKYQQQKEQRKVTVGTTKRTPGTLLHQVSRSGRGGDKSTLS